MTTSPRCFQKLKRKRRHLAGTTECSICGAEQLSHVVRDLSSLEKTVRITAELIEAGFDRLYKQQSLNRKTGASHAAGQTHWRCGGTTSSRR